MKKSRPRFRRVLYSLLPLPVVFLCGLLTWKWWNAPVEEQAQQLDSIDQFFETPRNALATTAGDETSLPDEVGSFKSADTQILSGCGANISKCFSRMYEIEERTTGWVIVTVRQASGKVITVLQQLSETRADTCGAEEGWRSDLRLQSKTPHLYQLCSGMFSRGYQVRAILWVNGDWVIEVIGNYADISRFMKSYPY